MFRLIVPLVLFLLSPCLWAQAVLPELKSLVDAGQYEKAWEMAQLHADEWLGEPDFDYLYGLAALDSGHSKEAVLALERVHWQYPENPRVKAELARAYFYSGNYTAARQLFQEVLAGSPPFLVQKRVQVFLDAIRAREKSRKASFSGRFSVDYGYDSNVNNATDTNDFIFGAFTLDASSKQDGSHFAEYRAELNISRPLSLKKILYSQLALSNTDYEQVGDISPYDSLLWHWSTGVAISHGRDRWRFPLTLQAFSVDQQETRHSATLGFEWVRPLSLSVNRIVLGQAGSLYYPGNHERNSYLALTGIGFSKTAFNGKLETMFMVLGGIDKIKRDDYEYNGKEFYSTRLGLTWRLSSRQQVFAALVGQYSHYEGVVPLLDLRRRDLLEEKTLGWRYRFGDRFLTEITASDAENHSYGNELFDYAKETFKAGVSLQF